MDNDHGITDELREWAKKLTHWWYDPVKNEYTYTSGAMPPSIDAIRLDSNILAIADRIDAEHESACAESYGNGVQSVALPDMTAYVKLPVDADGKVVRIGDVMVMASHPFGCKDNPLVVDRMELSRGMHGEVWCLALDTDRSCWTQAAVLRHYQPPTVEDVLRELVDEWVMADSMEDEEAAIAECAKKLQLRGDEQ